VSDSHAELEEAVRSFRGALRDGVSAEYVFDKRLMAAGWGSTTAVA
jgi:hypothetical protein